MSYYLHIIESKGLKKPEILLFPPLGHMIAAGGGSLLFVFEGTYPLFCFGRVVATILLFRKTRTRFYYFG